MRYDDQWNDDRNPGEEDHHSPQPESGEQCHVPVLDFNAAEAFTACDRNDHVGEWRFGFPRVVVAVLHSEWRGGSIRHGYFDERDAHVLRRSGRAAGCRRSARHDGAVDGDQRHDVNQVRSVTTYFKDLAAKTLTFGPVPNPSRSLR